MNEKPDGPCLLDFWIWIVIVSTLLILLLFFGIILSKEFSDRLYRLEQQMEQYHSDWLDRKLREWFT
jgi:hypothetical protein